MAWAREQADKETKLYKEATGKISVEFSKAACIPMNERRSFNVGYLFLQELCILVLQQMYIFCPYLVFLLQHHLLGFALFLHLLLILAD